MTQNAVRAAVITPPEYGGARRANHQRRVSWFISKLAFFYGFIRR